MTLNSAAWAIDGARINASLARRQAYAACGGAEGITIRGDLKVTPLTVPGPGLVIGDGSASVLNRYQTKPNEVYTVTNVGALELSSADMPPANPAARSHLVCITIGDPEFSQVGHPWMTGSDPLEGTEETFQYVRAFVIPNVPAGTTSFKQLNKSYPAIALARIDVPANTATITSSMIVDLRKLAQPREHHTVLMQPSTADQYLSNDNTWTDWPTWFMPNIDVPEWATHVSVLTHLVGVGHQAGDGSGFLRTMFGGLAGPNMGYDLSADNAERITTMATCEGDISAYAGTTQTLKLQGFVMPSWGAGRLLTVGGTQLAFDFTFYERAV